MLNHCSRKHFMQQGLTVTAGLALGCMNISCCARLIRRDSNGDENGAAGPAITDFDDLGYCSFNCQKECKVFAATKENDMDAKVELAKRWSKRDNREIGPEQVFCYGCQEASEVPGSYKENCSVRQCAQEKQVKTCAHCAEFPSCEQELWTEWPRLKERIQEIRVRLVEEPAS